jgi:hypothetical protein
MPNTMIEIRKQYDQEAALTAYWTYGYFSLTDEERVLIDETED